MGKVVIVTSSLRGKSNSDILANKVMEGAKEAGHDVEVISLKGKNIKFCIGCFTCAKTGECVLKDDVKEMLLKVKNADTLVFVTPIYYYEMSGQLKTFLDRMNPLYDSDYKFKNVYMVTCAWDTNIETPSRALSGLQGWVECFERAKFVDSIFLGGLNEPAEILEKTDSLECAFEFGRRIK